MTGDQCASLLGSAAQDHNESVHAFVMVGLHTGMRHSEILAIRRTEIDTSRRIIWIPKAKSGSRELPITRELCDYLEDRMRMLPPGCEWLFPSPGSKTGHTHITQSFPPFCLACENGLGSDHTSHASPHSRNAFGSSRCRSSNCPADIRAQDTVNGRPLCTPKRRSHRCGYG